MTVKMPGLAVEIAVANVDTYPLDLPGHPDWGANLEQLVPYLAQTGCRNFEIHPTRAIMRDIRARTERGDTEIIDEVVGSVHQTFSYNRDMNGLISDIGGVERSDASVASTETIAAASTHPMRAVYYLRAGARPANDKLLSIIQPFSEVYRDLGVRSNLELKQALAALGMLGFCPDTVHARRKARDGTRPPAVEEVWADQFASGDVYEMHVSADRVDIAKRDPELAALSAQEFKAFTSRRWQDGLRTEMGEMIVAAIESWVPPTRLTQLIGRPILRQVVELPPRPFSYLHRIRDHARFVENLAELAREAGATPLLWNTPAPG